MTTIRLLSPRKLSQSSPSPITSSKRSAPCPNYIKKVSTTITSLKRLKVWICEAVGTFGSWAHKSKLLLRWLRVKNHSCHTGLERCHRIWARVMRVLSTSAKSKTRFNRWSSSMRKQVRAHPAGQSACLMLSRSSALRIGFGPRSPSRSPDNSPVWRCLKMSILSF